MSRSVDTENGINFNCTVKRVQDSQRIRSNYAFNGIENLQDFLDLYDALEYTMKGLKLHIQRHFTYEEINNVDIAVNTPMRYENQN